MGATQLVGELVRRSTDIARTVVSQYLADLLTVGAVLDQCQQIGNAIHIAPNVSIQIFVSGSVAHG
jgi:hypothetical protein